MHNGKRRISFIALLALATIALAFPAGAAARSVPAGVRGAHVWSGELCDGTDVSVKYHVTNRGRLVFDSASGAPARVSRHFGWFRVRFEGVRMRALVHWGRRGVLHLHVRSWSRDCPPPPPPADDPPNDGGEPPPSGGIG